MRRVWSHREIDCGADYVWELLTCPEHWPNWGPSVRSAELDTAQLGLGATGVVETVIGARLGFEVTIFEPGTRWAWKVGGLEATDHTLDPLGPHRCRVGFGVPWPAAPYQLVCQLALRRIKNLAEVAV